MASKRKPPIPREDMKEPIEPRPKRPVGRPPKLVLKIDDTPQNVARSLFGIRSDKFPPKGKSE